ncbi:MAG: endonuclease/exonuclease/phosphatase family protein [Ginsengibacter sp.]
MPSFPKPKFDHTVNLSKEIKALRTYRDSKPELKIPAGTATNMRIATWNIANLGAQEREDAHLKMIAEILTWFDIIAVQEVKENSEHFQKIVSLMRKSYKFIFSDEGGNNERIAFIYNSKKLTLLQEVAELAVPPSEYEDIKITGVAQTFEGFDRNPYIASFRTKKFEFTLLSVHLYYGDDTEEKSINRRCLEAYCVGRWAELRGKSKYSFNGIKNVFALGDFNLPMIDEKDKIYKALVARGLLLPDHTSKIYSNISDDKMYDQIAFLPDAKSRIISQGVFPFDNAAFADIYNTKTKTEFKEYIKYYLSDHRPMWMELDISDIV